MPEPATRRSADRDTTVTYHLHPPMLRSMGIDRKMKFDARRPRPCARCERPRRLRGTLADPFRWAEVRQVERAMIPEYIDARSAAVQRRLDVDNLDDAVAIASLPDQVRGYEDLKLRRAATYRAELARRTT